MAVTFSLIGFTKFSLFESLDVVGACDTLAAFGECDTQAVAGASETIAVVVEGSKMIVVAWYFVDVRAERLVFCLKFSYLRKNSSIYNSKEPYFLEGSINLLGLILI